MISSWALLPTVESMVMELKKSTDTSPPCWCRKKGEGGFPSPFSGMPLVQRVME